MKTDEELASDRFLIDRINELRKQRFTLQDRRNWIKMYHKGSITKQMVLENLALTEEEITMLELTHEDFEETRIQNEQRIELQRQMAWINRENWG